MSQRATMEGPALTVNIFVRFAPLQIGRCIGKFVEQSFHACEIAAPGLRQHDSARQPLEQRYAERIFQHFHQPTHRVGGNIELSACDLEAARARCGLERADSVERR